MSPRVFVPALLVGLASVLLAGCGEESSCDEPVALPCDIRSTACRCSVFEATKDIRNQPNATLPPARVITRERYAAETRADSAGRMPSEADHVYQEALKLLALLPTGMSLDEAETEAQISGVAAYYDSREKKITIIEDAAEEQADGVFTLSHEYVHALQDQREVIAQQWAREESTDGLLSVKTLLEGEAVLLSDLVMFEIARRPFDGTALAAFDRLLDLTLTSIGMSPAPLTEAQLALAYPIGASVLGKAYLARGIEGVSAFYANRPGSVTGWLDESRAANLPGRLSCLTPDAPAGYKPWGVDRLGGTAMVGLGASLDFDNEAMREFATAWSSDLFALYSAMEGRSVALAWRIGFSDGAAATMLETRLRQAGSKLEVTRVGNEVLLIGGNDAAAVAGWSARNLCNAPKSRDPELTKLGPDFGRYLRARLGHHHGATAHLP
jgi:hypothetical protein